MLACICVLRYGICYYNFQLNVIYFFSVCVGTYMHVWRSEEKFPKLIFFSCHVTSRGYTHAANLGAKCFYLLTEHLTSLCTVLYCVCGGYVDRVCWCMGWCAVCVSVCINVCL